MRELETKEVELVSGAGLLSDLLQGLTGLGQNGNTGSTSSTVDRIDKIKGVVDSVFNSILGLFR